MVPSLTRATILNTEMRNFPSTIMGMNYQISTWFPPEYPKAGYQYPVIYLMDADVNLGLISWLVQGFIWDQMIPDVLIVGVGHDISTLDEWEKIREIDFTPVEHPDQSHPKRAADFLSFIKKELIPFIENTYPVDPSDRCLAGYSSGGKFTLYALLHDPDLFQRYFVGSVVWKNMLLPALAYEQQLAEQRKSLPVHTFFSMGELEYDQLPYFYQFIDAFKRRNYEGLCLETLIVAGEKHASAIPFAYSKGLRALYQPK
jgi:predicted alpha/beta superfamily hydrolase